MKKNFLTAILLLGVFGIFSCKEKQKTQQPETFESQGTLDSLINGQLNYGSEDVNKAFIRVLNFQKKYKIGKTNGVVMPKTMITQAVNGFTLNGINLPTDKSNFDKWDFMVAYPGLEINGQGEEKIEPSVFFYKGEEDSNGNLIPTGKPVTDITFRGGGGGPGDINKGTPPPTLP